MINKKSAPHSFLAAFSVVALAACGGGGGSSGGNGGNGGGDSPGQPRAMLFGANDGVHGTELWISDGTTDGTVMLDDIASSGGSSSPSRFFRVGDSVLFVAAGAGLGRELWKIDDAGEGAELVKDINPGSEQSWIREMHVFDGVLYFTADDGTHG